MYIKENVIQQFLHKYNSIGDRQVLAYLLLKQFGIRLVLLFFFPALYLDSILTVVSTYFRFHPIQSTPVSFSV